MAKDYSIVAEKYSDWVDRMRCKIEDNQGEECGKEFGDSKDMFRHLLQKHRKTLTKAELEAE